MWNDSCLLTKDPIDIYSPVVGQSPLIDGLLGQLAFKINREIDLQKDLTQAMGIMDMLFSKSGAGSDHTSSDY